MQTTILEDRVLNFRASDVNPNMDFVEKGTYGAVYKIYLQQDPVNKYALKKMDLNKREEFFKEKQEEIKREIEILRKLSSIIFKPRSIPKFHGYYITENPQIKEISYCLIFDLFEGSLKNLIEKKKAAHIKFSFDEVYTTFQVLINTMTFLQLNDITHRDLKPGNILFRNLNENNEIQYKSLTLIDYGGSKFLSPYKLNENNTVVLTKRYCSPELMYFSAIEKKDKANFDPFRSDIFSLGLILLEMGTFKLPFSDREFVKPDEYFKNLENENEKLIKQLEKNYHDGLKNSEEDKKKLKNIASFLRKALKQQAEKRPDFIEAFCDLLNIERKNSLDKNDILVKVIERDKNMGNETIDLNEDETGYFLLNSIFFFK